jgi:hypothetical protein
VREEPWRPEVSALTEHVIEHRRERSVGSDANIRKARRQPLRGLGHLGPGEQCDSMQQELLVRLEILRIHSVILSQIQGIQRDIH